MEINLQELNIEELFAADNNDPEVQYKMACCYLYGVGGVEADPSEAEKLLEMAARQGYAPAQQLLESVDQKPEEINEANLAEWCFRAEEQEDAEAQYMVGKYFLAQEAYAEEAKHYLRLAAEQGHPEACLLLGKTALSQGDIATAEEYLRNAADCSLGEAAWLLGDLLAEKGDAKALKEAEEYYIRAAEKMGAEKMLELAVKYELGDRAPRSIVKSLSWVEKARQAGMADAKERLEAARAQRGQETIEEMARAKNLDMIYKLYDEKPYTEQFVLYSRLAERGDAVAQYKLGNLYFDGLGVKKNPALAISCWRRAAAQGHIDAQKKLGDMYYVGEGVEQDYNQAAFWYSQAAEQGNEWAQFSLGECYYNGKGVKKDYTQAVEWYRKAAEQGHTIAEEIVAAEQGDADAQNKLGDMYYNGQGVEQDYARAIKWYRQAAGQGDANAQNNLGFCYAKGQGVEQDYTQAVYWYCRAVGQNHADANERFEAARAQRETEAEAKLARANNTK